MTTLITGGIGWVPSHIVRAVATTGEAVVSYDLMEPDDLFREFIDDLSGLVTIVRGDVTDLDGLRAVCSEYHVTSIIHAAAITPRREREIHEPERIIAVNLGGTINALNVARELPDFRRLVYVSSCAALGDTFGLDVVDETTASRATGLYGITKHTGERILSRYRDLFGLDAVSVRLANVYGPMERITPGYIGATELREMLRIHFDGQPVRINALDGPYLDWTYVGDIAEGIARIWSTSMLPHDLYSLTCGRLYSIGDVLESFSKYLPDFQYHLVNRESANYLVSGEAPGAIPSNARLTADLGWAPSTSLDDGMNQYLSWIMEHGPQ